jgi:GT2 family glycosyltransferase
MNHVTDDNPATDLSCPPGNPQPGPSGLSSADRNRDEPSVYVVLLNWNGWKDTLECVRSLDSVEYRNWHAVIVDNGSSDNSVIRLKELCPEIPILETHRNLGFAVGNNVGIRFALLNRADYVFVLNNDTTVFPDTISQFVKFAQDHPDAALLGPMIERRRNPQLEWPIRRQLDLLTLLCTFTALRRPVARIPILRDTFYSIGNQPSLVHALIGSALFFRAATFEKVGLFDESTFLDFEELIMAEKLRAARLSAYFVPQARIWHKGSASAANLQAKRYIENAKSEEYFLSNYVRLSSFARVIFKSVRFFTYGARALRYQNYREHFGEFVDALLSSEPIKVR